MSYDPRDHDYDYPVEYGICEDCWQECQIVSVDYGIGAYEYWGAKGVHHDYGAGSSCCEAEVFEGGCKEIRSSIHTARRDHKDGSVKAGQTYQIWVYRTYRAGGPSWVWTQKRVLDKKIGFPKKCA
jgi:hypothetical protein